MPELSRFLGIIIRMYWEVGARHHTPHFHAYYQESMAIFSIDPVDLMEGSMPRRQVRLVEAWAELHQGGIDQGLATIAGRSVATPDRATQVRSHFMQHGIYRVQSFDILSAYTLRVRFNDETEQVINFEPVLAGELFGPLRDLKLFNQVRIDPEVHTLVWPNGSDFESATLHDWPDLVDDLVALARQWEAVPA